MGVLAAHSLPVPVISVGNLSWGGTGKTPMTEYIVQMYARAGMRPLVLARGYGNDEHLQTSTHLPDAIVGVGADRVTVGRSILERHSALDVAVLDDGFQHWRLKRDLDIVMINSLNPWGTGRLIPRGPLREPMSALYRAQAHVLHHANLVTAKRIGEIENRVGLYSSPGALIVTSRFRPVSLLQVSTNTCVNVDFLQGKCVYAFSGIGSPEAFHLMLRESCGVDVVKTVIFPDHHLYSAEELRFLRADCKTLYGLGAWLITTEKDLFRCPEIATCLSDVNLGVVIGELEVDDEKGEFKKLLMSAVLDTVKQ
eukprot:CAMPEP_0184652058 /NCGR_PEP_ID=MMETSP0308-20130426/9717_1 /TAXON_ID=38269 /ORGANISM="Gloeochaete witrockiana, Strain SAG 46.84" /LENGTH=310 /DNA_ID=CAMNT_0027086685 /DNA_START=171 /DNA_END=1103 /DNA_ORIENTATION=+